MSKLGIIALRPSLRLRAALPEQWKDALRSRIKRWEEIFLNKLELLQELYGGEPQPVFTCGADFRIVWMNDAAIERFPAVLEGMDLREQFPGISFAGLEDLPEQVPSAVLRSPLGAERLTVQRFLNGGDTLYAAVWSDTAAYALEPGDPRSAEGVRLLDAWIRQGTFRIFNNLDQLAGTLERTVSAAAGDSMERIERSCQQLLRLSCNLGEYYGAPEDGGIPEDVEMGGFLDELLREVDFRLDALDIRLERELRCEGAVCRIDRRRFAAALLNLIDLSAAYAPENGRMKVEAARSEKELCITFRDRHTPAGKLKGGLGCTVSTLREGRSELCLPKVSLGLVDRVARESGGRCLLEGAGAGIKAVITLPLTGQEAPAQVRDEPSYTVRYRGQNRTSLVSILLSDLEE